jgi:UDP-N-acetyl-D-mannosaminuronic acid transferase (WecB/TagA/CpsF family)
LLSNGNSSEKTRRKLRSSYFSEPSLPTGTLRKLQMVPQTLHPELPQASILGIPVTLLDMPGTVVAIDQMISVGDPEMVVTANASAVVLAHDDPAFRADVLGAKLITVDGAGIQWALERKGMNNIAKVAGVELVEQLCYLGLPRLRQRNFG